MLKRLVLLPEMWNHYAAAVFRSRIPFTTIPTHRATRLAGRSRMNFVGLVAHGLSAISVFSDIVSVRLLLLTGLLGLLYLGAVAGLLLGATLTGGTVPNWGLGLLGLTGLLLVQMFALGVVFVMTTLSSRSSANFLPARDASHFVEDCLQVYPQAIEEEQAHEQSRTGPRRLAV